MYDISGTYVIVATRTQCTINVVSILQLCWTRYITNVILLIQHDNVTSIYTYFPFSPEYCERVEPVCWEEVLQDPSGGLYFRHGHDLFPDKLQNLFGCTLTLCPFQNSVYSIVSQNPNYPYDYLYSGIEASIFKEMARRMNFTLALKLMTGHPLLGSLEPNGSFTGIFGMVI